MSLRVFSDLNEWRKWRAQLDGSLGFVPTMGALHAGHCSLVRRSNFENSKTLVSIFVNPTQFNNPQDLEKYPRQLDQDIALLEEAGADYLIYPTREQMYPDEYRFSMQEKEFSKTLCGAHRPGHFDGMLSVVLKLLNIAQANRAYFGEKDFQQLRLIQDMVQAFFVPVEIIPCPTVREQDGLAMSSRNLNLAPQDREIAPLLYKTLHTATDLSQAREALTRAGFKLDYLEETHGRRFVAAHLGGVRLIDNISLTEIATPRRSL